jgi:hypothetical protein
MIAQFVESLENLDRPHFLTSSVSRPLVINSDLFNYLHNKAYFTDNDPNMYKDVSFDVTVNPRYNCQRV